MPVLQKPEDFLSFFLQLHKNKVSEQELKAAWLSWAKGLSLKDFVFLIHFRALLKHEQAGHLLDLLDKAEPQLEAIVLKKPCVRSPQEIHLQSIREIVLAQRYPEVKPSGDSDISCYFQLRVKKETKAASRCYDRLSDKYPDLELRANLLRWSRTGKGLLGPLYWLLRNQLADRLLEQVKKTIKFILRCFVDFQGSQAWDLLARIQTVIKILPADKSKAWDVVQHLKEFSQKLPFHAKEFASVSTLLEDYYSDTLFSRKEIRLILPKSLTKEANKNKRVTVKTFEVTQVDFTPKDLKEILINPKITGLENVTLSYCWQYFLKTSDPIFENKVYFYSLKHGTIHHNLFQIIKKGREIGAQDADILYALYNVVSRDHPYEYNVRKDIFMQNAWQRMKPTDEKKSFDNVRSLAEERILRARERKKTLKLKATETLWKMRQDKQEGRSKAQEVLDQSKALKVAVRADAEKKLQDLRKRENLEKKQISERIKQQANFEQAFLPVASTEDRSVDYNDAEQQGISLKELVQALNLPQEKNVHHLFRSHLEKKIHHFVQDFVEKEGLQVKAVHKTLAVLAVKDFFHNHYDKPYRSWILSNERMKVKDLGMNITNVEPIIESCLKDFS